MYWDIDCYLGIKFSGPLGSKHSSIGTNESEVHLLIDTSIGILLAHCLELAS